MKTPRYVRCACDFPGDTPTCPLANVHAMHQHDIQSPAWDVKAKAEPKATEHVCGLHGYNPMKDPPCPACEARGESRPAPEPPDLKAAIERIGDAYSLAVNLWGAQCFCFTSAPEQMRRNAHADVRDGLQELIQKIRAIETALLAREAAPPAVQPAMRFVWLMERRLVHGSEWNQGVSPGTLVYWDGGHAESFTTDPRKAVQWPTKEAAMQQCPPEHYAQWGWQYVEHGFAQSAPPAAQGHDPSCDGVIGGVCVCGYSDYREGRSPAPAREADTPEAPEKS